MRTITFRALCKGSHTVFLLMTLWHASVSPAQNHTIKGKSSGLISPVVFLYSYTGDRTTLVDSSRVDARGTFQFSLGPGARSGLYKIVLGKSLKDQFQGNVGESNFLNILFNNENIEFTTNIFSPVDSTRIIESEENRIYFDFLKRDKRTNEQLEMLQQLPSFFPKQDDLYPSLQKRYKELEKGHKNYTAHLCEKNPNTYAAHLIRSLPFPVMDFDLSPVQKQQFIVAHYFDNMDFADTFLLNTNILNIRAMAYMKYVVKVEASKGSVQDEVFNKIIDELMLKSAVNEKVNKQMKDFLIHGFEIMHNDKVLSYIYEHYVQENTCSDDKQASGLKKRVESAKKLAIGNKAPEIIFTDSNNKKGKLSEIKSEQTLLVFWASWCPHCQQTLPVLKDLYNKQKEKKFEILAVSMDTSKTNYDKAILAGGYNWVNCSDFKGWDGQYATDYCIYETPSFFLLDSDKKIIARPLSIDQLEKTLPK